MFLIENTFKERCLDLSKIKCSILIATICVGILTACGKTVQKPDGVLNGTGDVDKESSLVGAVDNETDDLSESDKAEMLSCIRIAEALNFGEFESVSELDFGSALYYACLKEYEGSSKDNLFSKYEIDVSESNDAKLSDEVVKEMLQRYFGNGDANSYRDVHGAAGEGVDISGIDIQLNVTVSDFVKSSKDFNSVVDSINVKLDEVLFADDVYKLLVDRFDDSDESSSKLEYGLFKNDDGSYCLKYKKVVG